MLLPRITHANKDKQATVYILESQLKGLDRLDVTWHYELVKYRARDTSGASRTPAR